MAPFTQSRPLGVCLISQDPGLLATMERLLAGTEFRVDVPPLAPETDFDLSSLRHRPSVFVVDVSSSSNQALIEQISSTHPQSRMIVIMETLKDEKIFPYLRLKVRGFVRYVDARCDLIHAIRAVSEGDIWLSRDQLVRFVDWILGRVSVLAETGQLSRREQEILSSMLPGLSNKEIAGMLSISESTVKFHVSRILRKFGVHRRSDLIAKQSKFRSIAS